MAAPVRKDQEIELRVDSLAYGGRGVARLNGFVVFVNRALPGDVVRARVTKVKRSHAEAVAVEVVEPGAPRVEAPCAHYPACGGCRFQDLAYEAQLEAKAHQVEDALRADRRRSEPRARARAFRPRRSSTTATSSSTRSRRSGTARSGSASTAPGRWDEVLDVERCWLTTDLGNGIREAVKAWARGRGPARVRPGARRRATSGISSSARGATPARRWSSSSPPRATWPGADELVAALRAFPEVRSIHWAVNDSPAEVTNLPSDLLWGEEAIEEEMLGLRFRVRPNAFLQTNTEMCEVLYSLAAEYAGLTGNETVYDLYCGIGHDRADACRARR